MLFVRKLKMTLANLEGYHWVTLIISINALVK